MKRKWWIALIAPPAIVLFIWIFGEIVMYLWNWLVPALFRGPVIGFWQALGLLVLCRLLFGGFGNHGHRGSGWRRRRTERWQSMTPEERERFRDAMRKRCGGFGEATAAGNEPS